MIKAKLGALTFSILLISFLSFISKLIGLMREGFVAYYFGTSAESDIFFLVYGIYGYVTSAVGVSFGVAFLPSFVNLFNKEGLSSALKKTSCIVNQLLLFTIPFTVIALLFSNFIARLIAPTYSIDSLLIVAKYIRILSLSAFASISFYILAAVLDGQRRFGLRQIIGMLFSLTTIVMIVLFHDIIGVDALAYSVFISAFIQFIILLVVVYRKIDTYAFVLGFKDPEIRSLYSMIIPVFLGTGIWYFRNIIDRVISSTLAEGSVSALNYSGTLFSLIHTLFISSIITVFYTELSKYNILENRAKLFNILKKGVITLLLILFPLAIYSINNSTEIITVLLKRGAFSEISVDLTSLAFSLYLLGTPFYAIRDLLTRYCYVISDAKTPIKNSCISLLINIPLSYFLSKCLGVGGITLSSAIVSILLCVLLLIDICRKNQGLWEFLKVGNTIFKISLAAILTFALMSCFNMLRPFANPIIHLVISAIILFVIYIGLLTALKCQEIRSVFDIVLFKKRE